MKLLPMRTILVGQHFNEIFSKCQNDVWKCSEDFLKVANPLLFSKEQFIFLNTNQCIGRHIQLF